MSLRRKLYMTVSPIPAMLVYAGDEGGAGGGAGGAGDTGGGAGGGGAGGAGGGGAGGGGGDPWYSSLAGLDPETKTHLEGKNFPSLEDALRSGMHSDRVARDRNVITRPDPTKLKDWDGFEALGWPKEFGDYKLAEFKPVEGAGPINTAFLGHVTKAAHDAKIPPAQFEPVLHAALKFAQDDIVKRAGDAQTEQAQRARELDTQLKTEWGTNFDGNKELAQRAFKHLKVSDDEAGGLEAMAGSPAMMKLFHRLGTMLGEDTLKDPNLPAGSGSPSKASATAELNRLKGDAEWTKSYTDPRHPNHAAAKQQHERLMEAITKG